MVSMKRIREAIENNEYQILDEDLLFQYGFGALAVAGGFTIIVDGESIYLETKKVAQRIPLAWFKIDKKRTGVVR